MPRGPSLQSMSVEKLYSLRGQVEAALAAKVTEERRTLQAELGKLERFGVGRMSGKALRGGRMGPVAPKYRNPDNPSETWAGRGLKPRWISAALKAGKKLEDFAIAGATKSAAKRMPRKVGRAAKK
jgi:DNA-binding protein H-NS